MIRWIFILLLTVAGSFAATLTCANTTQSAFVTQYNAASDGDTIIIPAGGSAGSPTSWTGVTINKAITIQGTLSGTNWATFIRNPTDYIFKVDVSSDKKIRICYIDFDHTGTFSGSDKAAIYINDANGGHTTNLRIDHNYFGAYGSKTIGGWCWFWGVIDHNYFKNSDSDIFLTGHDRNNDSGNDGTYQWTRSKVIGDTNRVVIESNTFRKDTGITADPNEILYGQGSPRAIFRFNWVDATANTGQKTYVIDAHGKFGSGSSGQEYSTISYEIYGNTINVDSGGNINLRGGRHLVYSNTVTTASGSPSWALKDEGADTYGVPPGPVSASSYNADNAGTGGQWITNTFCWANTLNGSTLNLAVATDGLASSAPYIIQNTHYFLRAPTTGDSSDVVNGSTLRQLVFPHPRVTAEDGGGGGGTTGGGGSYSSSLTGNVTLNGSIIIK